VYIAAVPSAPRNVLHLGDNLTVLRRDVADDSVDLVYLDPPFNSKRSYEALVRPTSGARGRGKRVPAFDDNFTWNADAARAFETFIHDDAAPARARDALRALRDLLGDSGLLAYLTMMTPRLVELRRVLAPRGSLYLHCDPTASHYLKLVLDAVFGPECFRNEIIWRRTGAHGPRRSFGPVHDVILFYVRSPRDYHFDVLRKPYMVGHVRSRYREQDDGRLKFTSGGNVLTGAGATGGESGQPWRGFDPSAKDRHWAIPGFLAEQMGADFAQLGVLAKLDALLAAGLVEIAPGAAWPTPVRYLRAGDGTPIPDIWAYQPYTEGCVHGSEHGVDHDVAWIGPTDPERVGYPTQKPLGLLGRIIASSCPADGVVLDPFCGSGTTVVAASKLGRRWIAIDSAPMVVDLLRQRLAGAAGDDLPRFEVRDVARVESQRAPAKPGA
jgi:site-specific DNA-methyltransferase (adenine-specific)